MNSSQDASSPARHQNRRLTILLTFSLLCAGTLVMLTQCGGQYALLITLRATSHVETFHLLVKDLSTNQIILERKGEQVDPQNPQRDISQPGQELKLAVEFVQSGNYLVYLLGLSSTGIHGRQFFLRDYQVDGVREVEVVLLPLEDDVDQDKDGFPACGAPVNCNSVACNFLDCNDNDPGINPMGTEVCGNGVDEDCSAGCNPDPAVGDLPCNDNDGDGESAPGDCDDNDPCRSSRFKEASRLCPMCFGGLAEEQFVALPQACLDKMKAEGKTLTPPYCGDGIDQDCNGKDSVCIIDQDCDCFSPGSGENDDCNDEDSTSYPGAGERCDDLVDNNCDGEINEGCLPCDIDGDGHAAENTVSAEPACENLPKDDFDDMDAGRYPGVTDDTQGNEGGAMVLTALREFCSYKYDKDSTLANPLRHRDVDHDGDKLAAKDDGCPAEACDQDGDGYEAPSCNPPASKQDCDDSNPHIFPGAPDKAEDGIAQNCVTDSICPIDKDGDGYCADTDCDDNDPDSHPWAIEKCDNKDNDCDGLRDEGNPDHLGNLIGVLIPGCTNDNDGFCAAPCKVGEAGKDCFISEGRGIRGRCACSRADPNTTRDEGNRVACAGEDMALSASPRCFSARIPGQEQCKLGDFNCDGHDILPGEPFIKKGTPCSKDEGDCALGVIDDCDLSRTKDDYENWAKIVEYWPDYVPAWHCTGELPLIEVCNGRDDDCDSMYGLQPTLMDSDGDGDGWLTCNTCTQSDPNPRKNLDTQNYAGCGDCSGNPDIFPTQAETCNNMDDNCVLGITDDGVDQCGPLGISCCSTQQQCRDLLNDAVNCGDCGVICDTSISSGCVNGSCVCGGANGACGNGQDCVNGSCTCIPNGNCSGCCSTDICHALISGQSATRCGAGGNPCETCDDQNDCTDNICSATGVCSNPAKANGTLCDNSTGRCNSGSCCKGCVLNGICHNPGTAPVGTPTDYCGIGGRTCATCKIDGSCTGADCQCKFPDCSTGTCQIRNQPSSLTCNDNLWCTINDTCSGSGTCGGDARDCGGESDQCNLGVCNESTDQCVKQPANENALCNDGLFCKIGEKCQGGQCLGTDRVCAGDQCNTGYCDEGSDACAKTPANGGSACNDGFYCTVNETCSGGVCQGGTARNCSSYTNQCNNGVCNESGDTCESSPKSGSCDDGQYCTVNETCSGGVCQGGTARDCSSYANQCNNGVCNESADTCESSPKSGSCNDGQYCTVNESCSGGVCQGGTARDCSSFTSQCNVGTCNESTDQCYAAPTSGGCNDGLYCTVNETCSGGVCQGGTTRDCSSYADQCNNGVCNESGDTCEKMPANGGSACNDGFYCTVNETCSGGECQGGTARNCSSYADQCNNGVCNESGDTCEASPKSGNCTFNAHAGNCLNGSCCTGCLDVGSCVMWEEQSEQYCGIDGDSACLTCVGADVCETSSGTCVP